MNFCGEQSLHVQVQAGESPFVFRLGCCDRCNGRIFSRRLFSVHASLFSLSLSFSLSRPITIPRDVCHRHGGRRILVNCAITSASLPREEEEEEGES